MFPVPCPVNVTLFKQTRSIQHCDIPESQTWHYVEFLFESLKMPRNKTEALLKKRYGHWYAQYKNLGLTAEQYVGCGRYKQVFQLGDRVGNRVIKIFSSHTEWERERQLYEELVKCIPDSLLPHEYQEGFAECDRAELLSRDRAARATAKQFVLEQSVPEANRRDLVKMLKAKLITDSEGGNLGLWQGRLVWIDVGDARHCRRLSQGVPA
jgi:hypothetical protein